MKTIHRAGFISGVALLALSASGAAAQEPEMWQLAQVNGAALPFVTDPDDDGCREELASATLALHADGRWVLELNEREVCADRVEDETEDEDGRYTAQGDAITFLDDDGEPENGNDVDDLASATRSGATLTARNGAGDITLVFRR